jgi:hypothetical protein
MRRLAAALRRTDRADCDRDWVDRGRASTSTSGSAGAGEFRVGRATAGPETAGRLANWRMLEVKRSTDRDGSSWS